MKFEILVLTIFFSVARCEYLTPGLVSEFILQPVRQNADTSLTVFRGILTQTISPQLWHFEFFGIAPEGLSLVSTRRWVSNLENLTQPFSVEMTYYREGNSTGNSTLVPGCCSHTPLFDRFEYLSSVNDYRAIRYAGQPAILKLTSAEAKDEIDIEPWISAFEPDSGLDCPLKCLSPVDVVFNSDASGSIDRFGESCEAPFDGGYLYLDTEPWEGTVWCGTATGYGNSDRDCNFGPFYFSNGQLVNENCNSYAYDGSILMACSGPGPWCGVSGTQCKQFHSFNFEAGCAGADVCFTELRNFCTNGPNWRSIRNFIGNYKERYLFTPSFSGAHFGLIQFSGYGALNQAGKYQDVFCRLPGVNASSMNVSDWGENFTESISRYTTASPTTNADGWMLENCVPRSGSNWTNPPTEEEPCAGNQTGTSCSAAWAQADAELSGNEAYFDYRLSLFTNNWMIRYGPEFEIVLNTGIGHGIALATQELQDKHRQVQQILVTLTDGQENRGITTKLAVQRAKDALNVLDGPQVRFVGVAVGNSVTNATLLAAADGLPENTLRVDDFANLDDILDRLVALTCDAEFNQCQDSCLGLCSPCGECLCPSCPTDLACQEFLRCENGRCVYQERDNCCPPNVVEQCERKGGTITASCECSFGTESDTTNLGAVLGGTLGGLVGAVLLGLLALLLLTVAAVVVVTIIILILKAQAIAAAVASLGANAFGLGASDNPTYENVGIDGENPLFAAAL